MKGKRLLSLLLCLIMVLSCLPISIFAINNGEGYCLEVFAGESEYAPYGKTIGGFSIEVTDVTLNKSAYNESSEMPAGSMVWIDSDLDASAGIGDTIRVDFTAPDGYAVDTVSFYNNTGGAELTGLQPTITKSNGDRSVTVIFTPTSEKLGAAFSSGDWMDMWVRLKKPVSEKTVTYHPYADAPKLVHTQKIKEGETVNEPSIAEIETDAQLQKGYFAIMQIDGWYTDQALTKPYTFGQTLSEDINLYAKVSVRDDAKFPINYQIYVWFKNSGTKSWVSKTRYITTDKKITATNPGYQIDVGKPFNDLPTNVQITSGQDLGVPKYGLKITGWVNGTGDVFENRKNFTAKEALAFAKQGGLNLYAVWEGEAEVSFTSTIGMAPKNMRCTIKVDGSGGINPKLTSEQIKTLTDWAAALEKTDNYIFKGWYASNTFSGSPWVFEGNNTDGFWNDTTLYARWVAKKTVTFDMSGKPTSNWKEEDFTKTVGEGDKLPKPTAPVAVDNDQFLGWFTDPNCAAGNEWDFNTPITDDITLYAKWATPTKHIKLKFQWLDPDDITDETWKTGETLESVPILSNYKFGQGGFSIPTTPADDSGSRNLRTLKYADKWTFVGKGNATYTLNADTILADCIGELTDDTLVVTAEASPYITVTFNADGGQFADGSETYTTGPLVATSGATAAAPTADPTKDGYRFGGWYKDAAKSDPFDAGTDKFTQNTTIYAKWKDIPSHEITFEVTDKQTKAPITDAVITVKNSKDEVVTPVDGKYTLKEGTYNVTVTATGYKTASGPVDIGPDSSKIPVELDAFVAVTGITLTLDKVMKTKEYTLADYVTITPEKTTKKDIVWSAAETLPAGVTLADGKLTISADAAENAQIKLKATIEHGALAANGTTELDYTKDFTLTVTKYLATITFAHGTGDHPDITLPEKKTVNEDTTLTAPDDPTDDNWTFKGWFTNPECTTAWQEGKEFTADATLYAKWELKAIKVTLTFNGGDGTQKNSGVENTLTLDSGTTIKLPPCMFTKEGYIFSAWQPDGESGSVVADTSYKVPRKDVTFTAKWTEIATDTSVALIEQSIKGITESNASKYQPQLFAARDAAHTNPDAGKNTELRSDLEKLFLNSGIAKPTVNGNAATNAAQSGAILSSNGQTVTLTIDKGTAATLPSEYQSEEYKSAWRNITMKHGLTALEEPLVPVLVTMPIPDELSGMAADTIRVLVYGSDTEPTVMRPTVTEDGKLTFSVETLGQYAFVGKAISDAADTRVTALVMKYNGKVMGNVVDGVIKPDANGNFEIIFPSTLNQTAVDDLSLGTNWKTYLTVAPQAKVATAENPDGYSAEDWAKTGVALQFDLSGTSATDTITLTAIAQNGNKRTFTITAKKNTKDTPTYKIAVSNISGGTVTATPNPAAAGEEVKLTVEPNDGKKLIAGSLSYCLQSAGAKSVPIDETTLTFIMPAGDININAQFEDDASAPIKNPPQITAFMINGVSAVINQDTKVITIILPYGTDLKHVAPTIVTANASKVEPSSAQRVDLSTPKAYRVYASNGAYVTYTVTAYTEEPSPTQSLWEKLQNQINSNPNWWELAEYQKKTGYYK